MELPDVPEGAPPAFARALQEVRAVRVRPQVVLSEVPPPRRLAPWGLALSADVTGEGGQDAAEGRFVLLHDPEGQAGWVGTWRVVVLARCSPDEEVAGDPLLPGVGWSWLIEALAAHDVRAGGLGGTVTRSVSQGFGDLVERGSDLELEVRASWSPDDDGAAASLRAWAHLLATAAGLPPQPVAVPDLPPEG